MSSAEGVVVGLDIGTTKVCAVIGERGESGAVEITGVGTSPSTGLRKGVVVNIEATLRSVREAIENAEMMSGKEVKSCWAGIGGSHIDGLSSRGVVAVGKSRETREISRDDIERVMEAARAVLIPMDREILAEIPQSFIVDNQKGIRNPIGMIGVRLEAEVYIITCSGTGSQNIANCVNRAGFLVNDFIFQSLAAGRAVLMDDEKERGIALVDLGGGTTDLLVYQGGAPLYTASLPVGGIQVTGDIAALKQIAFEDAERVKIDAGCCWGPYVEGEDVLVPGRGGRAPESIAREEIFRIVKPRMEEIFLLVKEKLDALFPPGQGLGAGVVLTGGGAKLSGALEFAQDIFGVRTRIGLPLAAGGLVEEYRSPVYAAAVGLVLEGNDRETRGLFTPGDRQKAKGGKFPLARIWDWLREEIF
ncbi:MAG: cell division protein FtsA [Treponema sp.]|jgi:cell division protein FtsA|nr:cell division protein FtsA [Treponema sp.]